jgi:hypothetical protein
MEGRSVTTTAPHTAFCHVAPYAGWVTRTQSGGESSTGWRRSLFPLANTSSTASFLNSLQQCARLWQ